MGIKNFQYNRIFQEYDAQQIRNKHLLVKRQNEVYQHIPEYKSLEEEIISLSIAQAKASLLEEELSSSQYLAKIETLLKRKKALLKKHGFSPDYLDNVFLCKDCKDTGYINNEKCHCFKQSIVNVLYEQANLGTILYKENFHTFQTDYYDKQAFDPVLKITPFANITKIVAECKRFTQNFDIQYSNVLLYGNTGVGKTFLANCIAKELLDTTHTVVYLTAFELFDILEKNKFSKVAEEKSDMGDKFHYILNSDLLIIDDLGTELVNSFSASQVYLCINERHLKQKSTIISTNLSLDDIAALYSERVFSRIISDYQLFKIIGEDIRLKKAFTP